MSAEHIVLDVRESRHLVRVLRAKIGEEIEVLDGRGTRYEGRIVTVDAKAVQVRVSSVERLATSGVRVTLLQSIPKGKTMDLILRMATEIGVTQIQPVFTHQGEVQLKGERLRSKVEKWHLTMIESCKQCGLAYLPELSAPVSLPEWLSGCRRNGEDWASPVVDGDKPVPSAVGLRIVASLEAGSRPLREVLEGADRPAEIVVAVGPEGDFTAGEYAALRETGFRPVKLAANVLRAETAAAYLLSVVDQSMGA